jgi:membrane AbrB-like protein
VIRPPAEARRWGLVAVCVLLVTLGAQAVSLPSPSMLAGLLVGIVYATRTQRPLVMSNGVSRAAQAVSGATIGTYVSVHTLTGIGQHWLPVIATVVVTLVLTFAAGLMLARLAPVSPATAVFGMIAGGAAGIVSIADDLGADDRMVAVMQYLRVIAILLATPVISKVAFSAPSGPSAHSISTGVSFAASVLFLAIAAPAGVVLGNATRMTSPSFFGPMVIGVGLTLSGVPFAGAGPNLIPYVAYAAIGAKVGLEFTAASLRQARAILAPTLAMILAMLVACAALGLLMAPLAHVSSLDGYLATTPGVLQVVLATAVGLKANTTFILSTQVLRLLMMLSAAPAVARRLVPMDLPPPTEIGAEEPEPPLEVGVGAESQGEP